jgi:hypothetical protein
VKDAFADHSRCARDDRPDFSARFDSHLLFTNISCKSLCGVVGKFRTFGEKFV